MSGWLPLLSCKTSRESCKFANSKWSHSNLTSVQCCINLSLTYFKLQCGTSELNVHTEDLFSCDNM